jgi:molecular chaperone GrpE
MALPTWFRKGEEPENPDEVPTGQIAAVSLTQIIEDADSVVGNGAGKVPAQATGTEPMSIPAEPEVPPADPVSSVSPDTPGLERALAERQSLIQLCLYALDRARSGGVVERLEHGLAAIGVRALRPDGDKFDPALHEAGGALPTDDVALDGVVAETEVPGFADRERLLRAPVVTVYTKRTS